MNTEGSNLTQGSVLKKLWIFTLPFIGANLLQTLYGIVDLYIIGQHFGSGDRTSLGGIFSTAFTLSLIAGAGLMVVVAAFTVPALHWINTPEEAMESAISYMLICSVGYIFQAVYNMLAGILREWEIPGRLFCLSAFPLYLISSGM